MDVGLSLEVTNACHLRCKTCLPSSGKPRDNELTTEEIGSALRSLRSKANRILFSGGEPFYRPDFLSLLRLASQLDYRVSVNTSGTYALPDILTTLRETDTHVYVSFDGAHSATHDSIRGRGQFAQALSFVSGLGPAGISWSMLFTISRPNVGELRDALDLARSYSASSVVMSEVVQAGRAARHWDLLRLDDVQRESLPQTFLDCVEAAFGDQEYGDDESCTADGTSLYASATGDVYLCSELFQVQRNDMIIGSLRDPDKLAGQLDQYASIPRHHACCYRVFSTAHATLIQNVSVCHYSPTKRSASSRLSAYPISIVR